MTTREEAEAKVNKNSEAFVNVLTKRLGRQGVDFVMRQTVKAVISGQTEVTRAKQIANAMTTLVLCVLCARSGDTGAEMCAMVHRLIDHTIATWRKDLIDAGHEEVTTDDQAALASPVPESGTVSGRMDGVAHVKH